MSEINYNAESIRTNHYPKITKLGACSPNGEVTPFVWKGKLMRMELDDPSNGVDKTINRGAVIRDCETGQILSHFAEDSYFHSGYLEGDTFYVLGRDQVSMDTIRIYSSKDLIHWDNRILFQRPGWVYCNTGLTKGPVGYVLCVEAGEPAELVGEPYTLFFATSPDLVTWTHLPVDCCLSRERYNGGPWMRYSEGWYYVISVTMLPCRIFTNYIFRTKNFADWEIGHYNPILMPGPEDHIISPNAHDLTPELIAQIGTAYNINNSDIDMCDWDGKVYINYLCGNQLGCYWMAEAVAEGTVAEFLKSYFE